MSEELKKRTGIVLTKGSGISLVKADKPLESVAVGLNWGAINQKSFFGLFSNDVAVDLDGTVTLFDEQKRPLETVYYGSLKSSDGSVKHSGDDRSGDVGGDDGRDNEVITIDLSKISPQVSIIYIYLNSFNQFHFGEIPFTKVRVFEGDRKRVDHVLATFNLNAESGFDGKVSMVMGKLVKENGTWKFIAIGQAIAAKDIEGTINYLKTNNL
jgi:tellurium resistance protein TerZ